jgi:hypothetical protein
VERGSNEETPAHNNAPNLQPFVIADTAIRTPYNDETNLWPFCGTALWIAAGLRPSLLTKVWTASRFLLRHDKGWGLGAWLWAFGSLLRVFVSLR